MEAILLAHPVLARVTALLDGRSLCRLAATSSALRSKLFASCPLLPLLCKAAAALWFELAALDTRAQYDTACHAATATIRAGLIACTPPCPLPEGWIPLYLNDASIQYDRSRQRVHQSAVAIPLFTANGHQTVILGCRLNDHMRGRYGTGAISLTIGFFITDASSPLVPLERLPEEQRGFVRAYRGRPPVVAYSLWQPVEDEDGVGGDDEICLTSCVENIALNISVPEKEIWDWFRTAFPEVREHIHASAATVQTQSEDVNIFIRKLPSIKRFPIATHTWRRRCTSWFAALS
ncbi:uncharacterized protein EV422DRAFT_326787 [Fimicolochytrium jonesii]|uniref:uncharacterized protein n=1 Tax=Fimicolochytrium jonesii TaxID=1396493 RepID=UPI0022FE7171|nr:uncharacterized protein EV422DRAFT_326787 [Fimicolochytrium jonesii]KAI8816125.1 hypothetical protein EV422DRAFT_326787 [Fimicolochytrium jonesii]